MRTSQTSAVQQERTTAERPWPPSQGEWTYEDWLRLPDDGYCYEVVDRVLFISPPPRIEHQRIVVRLIRLFGNFVEDHHLGEVLVAPVGVRLPSQPIPLQPDVLFIQADRLEIIEEDYVEGAPDLVMEILSPSNWLYDRGEKMQAYQDGGVTEYWVVDPRAGTIEVYVLEQGAYLLVGKYERGETAQSQIVPGFEASVDGVFTT